MSAPINKGWTLITGSAKHLGRTLALRLASEGYPVVIHYRESHKEALQAANLCREYGVKAGVIQGDLCSKESVQKMVEDYLAEFGDTVNLINNVGMYWIESALETDANAWREMYEANFFAPLTLIQSLLPSIKQRKGRILNIGCTGLLGARAHTYAAAYMSTRQSLLHLTRSLAKELAPDQIGVNMISPGFLPNAVDMPDQISTIPMGRVGTYEEIAALATFLLSDENSYITGQNIEVSGGQSL